MVIASCLLRCENVGAAEELLGGSVVGGSGRKRSGGELGHGRT